MMIRFASSKKRRRRRRKSYLRAYKWMKKKIYENSLYDNPVLRVIRPSTPRNGYYPSVASAAVAARLISIKSDRVTVTYSSVTDGIVSLFIDFKNVK